MRPDQTMVVDDGTILGRRVAGVENQKWQVKDAVEWG